jgi:leucyl/phenylalanyl-tRNA--protein transferase
MASHRDDATVHWVAPAMRGILPLVTFHTPRRLQRIIRSSRYQVRVDTAFTLVVDACSAPRPEHPETWINSNIAQVFCDLHRLGYAHSVEAWQDDHLVGGLYGLALGGAFFGESMFSRERDASKVALVHLVALLALGGYVLLDIQFVTEHLRRFGAIEIPAAHYLQLLEEALPVRAQFVSDPDSASLAAAVSAVMMQSSTQTS